MPHLKKNVSFQTRLTESRARMEKSRKLLGGATKPLLQTPEASETGPTSADRKGRRKR